MVKSADESIIVPKELMPLCGLPNTVFIYTLSDPITKEICYVGQTDNIKNRFYYHCNTTQGNHRKDWWISVLSHHYVLLPIMTIINYVDTSIAGQSPTKTERTLIKKYRGSHPVLNISPKPEWYLVSELEKRIENSKFWQRTLSHIKP